MLRISAVWLVEHHDGGFVVQRGPVPMDAKLVVAISVDRINEVAAHAVLGLPDGDAVAHDECDKSQNKSWRHNQPKGLRWV